MRLLKKKDGKIILVKPDETKLDAGVAEIFKTEMATMIDDGNRFFVLDLGNVDFMDSSFLGAIISSLKRIGEGGNIAILGASSNVTRLFKLTKLDQVFPMFDNENEAIKSVKFPSA